jgi:hypothetical protein
MAFEGEGGSSKRSRRRERSGQLAYQRSPPRQKFDAAATRVELWMGEPRRRHRSSVLGSGTHKGTDAVWEPLARFGRFLRAKEHKSARPRHLHRLAAAAARARPEKALYFHLTPWFGSRLITAIQLFTFSPLNFSFTPLIWIAIELLHFTPYILQIGPALSLASAAARPFAAFRGARRGVRSYCVAIDG